MALLNQSVQVPNQLGRFFEILREGQAPEKFSKEHLKSLGFTSSNHLAFIPLLKGLGLLTSDGKPTDRYKEFLDKTKWKRILSEAVRDAYGDIFVLRATPTKADKDLIAGKFKSTYNMSETQADRSASTFLALLELCDPDALRQGEVRSPIDALTPKPEPPAVEDRPQKKRHPSYESSLNYNIQIHLPATKDFDVYNAIFKSLKEHLMD